MQPLLIEYIYLILIILGLVMLADELREIQEATAQIDVVGTRYTEAMEKSTGL